MTDKPETEAEREKRIAWQFEIDAKQREAERIENQLREEKRKREARDRAQRRDDETRRKIAEQELQLDRRIREICAEMLAAQASEKPVE